MNIDGYRTRTAQMNKYLWGYVYASISIRMREYKMTLGGYEPSPEVVHEACKNTFGKWDENREEFTTRTMSTVEMMDYWEQIKEFASRMLLLYIKDPNEVVDSDLIEQNWRKIAA